MRHSAEIIAAKQQLLRWRADPVLFVRQALKAEPDPWQLEALQEVATNDRIAIRSGHGVGKALSVNEPVLTKYGWVPIGDVKVGDHVATVDGSFTEVIGVYPQGEKELYRVTLDDGCSVVVDEGHLWSTSTRNSRKHYGGRMEVRTTAEIAATLTFPNGSREGLNHCLPTMAAVQHARAALPLDPYLLGVWIGDGRKEGAISGVSEAKKVAFVDYCEGNAIAVGKVTEIRQENWRFQPLGIGRALKLLGLFGLGSHERFIPTVYRFADIHQRIALLQGILDTDGTVGTNNAVVLDQTSPRLADDVSELVRSLGGVVRRSEKWGVLNGIRHRRVYRLYISLPPDVAPFRMPEKANRYRPSEHRNRSRVTQRFIASVTPEGRGDATCIRVAHPSALFVTRDHIVTHNSVLGCWIVLWFMNTRFPCKVPITGANFDQLRATLWAELSGWLGRMPEQLRAAWTYSGEALKSSTDPEEAFAALRTASKDRAQGLAGFHSANVLVVVDEASAVDDAIFEVLRGALTTAGAKLLLMGNPTQRGGTFYRAHNDQRAFYATRRVSCLDTERVSRDWITEQADLYGEESNTYRVRVLGEFPSQDYDGVIPLDLIEAAVERDVVTLDVPTIWGLDVARYGDDRSALAKRQGNALVEPVKTWAGLDTEQLAGRIVNEWRNTDVPMRPESIAVDVIGIGAGVFDKLKNESRFRGTTTILAINVAEAAASSDRYERLRDELWWRAREWFAARDCKLVDDQALVAELSGPKYEERPSGKIKVESKDMMKERGVKSPDRADAFIMTFAASHSASRVGMPIWAAAKVETAYNPHRA